MRYSVGFVLLLLALVASPLSVSAQAGEEGVTSELNLDEPAPASEPAPEEPALQIELDSAGVEVVPSPPRTVDGYTLEEMELRVKRAKIGLGVSGGIYALGLGLAFGVFACAGNPPADGFTLPGRCHALSRTGVVLGLGGLIGIIISGVRQARHKRDQDWLRRAHYASAQAGDEHSLSFRHDEASKIALFSSSPAPSPEPAPEEPALQLKLDSAGVEVVPSPPRTFDGYTLEQMDLRVHRARIGLIASASLLAGGAIVLGSLASVEGDFSLGQPPPTAWTVRWVFGGMLTGFGAIGMIASGTVLRRSKRDRDSLRAAHYRTPRRVQWDLARSRLVF